MHSPGVKGVRAYKVCYMGSELVLSEFYKGPFRDSV